MLPFIDTLALTLMGAGIFLFLLSLVMSRHLTEATVMMLDLWTAAGLLHLSGLSDWHSIAMVANVIIIRKLVASALKRSRKRPSQPLSRA